MDEKKYTMKELIELIDAMEEDVIIVINLEVDDE